MNEVREQETPEETKQRRQANRAHMNEVREQETPEETEQRRQVNRTHMT